VDAITRKPGKTLDQARAEIVAAMTLEKRRAALTDMSAKIEQQFENGTSLADVAKSMGLTVQTTAPLLATGQVFGKPAEKAPADVAPLLAAVFSMEREGEPQISEVPGSTKFALFDVGEITEAAPRRWRRSRTWSRAITPPIRVPPRPRSPATRSWPRSPRAPRSPMR
jgi:peptidyl-prolyl cis-trans isomerase D